MLDVTQGMDDRYIRAGRIGGLDTYVLIDRDNTSAEFALFGAHPMSFRPLGDSRDIFFLSPESFLNGMDPVRGGMPNCFPWFGPGQDGLPLHGIARTQEATLAAHGLSPHGHPFLTMVITHNEETLKQWPHRFVYSATHTLYPMGLETCIEVENRNSSEAFPFQLVLHTYFSADAKSLEIEGLKGLPYTDKRLNGDPVEGVDMDGVRRIEEYTDRVYRGVPDELTLRTGLRRVVVAGRNLPDAVVWCAAGQRDLPDLPRDVQWDYCCLERGAISRPVQLEAGQKWCCTQTVRVSYI